MQYLYRAFDHENKLLYVGVSGKWSERLHQHEKTSQWMDKTDWVKIERYPDRDSVLNAERAAIIRERPLFNKDFSVDYERPMDHLQKLKFWIYYDTPVDDTHQEFVETAKLIAMDRFPDSFNRKQVRYVAWLLMSFWIHSGQTIDCRNCEAVANHGQFQQWAEKIDDELTEEGNIYD